MVESATLNRAAEAAGNAHTNGFDHAASLAGTAQTAAGFATDNPLATPSPALFTGMTSATNTTAQNIVGVSNAASRGIERASSRISGTIASQARDGSRLAQVGNNVNTYGTRAASGVKTAGNWAAAKFEPIGQSVNKFNNRALGLFERATAPIKNTAKRAWKAVRGGAEAEAAGTAEGVGAGTNAAVSATEGVAEGGLFGTFRSIAGKILWPLAAAVGIFQTGSALKNRDGHKAVKVFFGTAGAIIGGSIFAIAGVELMLVGAIVTGAIGAIGGQWIAGKIGDAMFGNAVDKALNHGKSTQERAHELAQARQQSIAAMREGEGPSSQSHFAEDVDRTRAAQRQTSLA